MRKNSKGFTLIELLVVISILGILIGLTLFGIGGARESSRDAKRKADLELIRGGVEIYKADCNEYPVEDGVPSDAGVLATDGLHLTGDNSPVSCAGTNIYMGEIPEDPQSPNSYYRYYSDGEIYQVCAHLESGSAGVVTCGNSSDCNVDTSKRCNYRVTNP